MYRRIAQSTFIIGAYGPHVVLVIYSLGALLSMIFMCVCVGECDCSSFLFLLSPACQESADVWCGQAPCLLHLYCINHTWSLLQTDLYNQQEGHYPTSNSGAYTCWISHHIWSHSRRGLHTTSGSSAEWRREYSRQCGLHHSSRW